MSDRTVVVTGGGTGIGRGVAAAFARGGDRVLVVGRRKEVLEACAAELGGRVTTFRADVGDSADVDRLAAHVRDSFGTVDVLVNNAGGAHRQPVESTADLARKWAQTLTQNVVSAVITTHAVQPLLRRPGGRIVVISSAAARSPGGDAAYASAKAALNRWIVTLASDVGAEGITANVVAPGFVPDTELYGPTGAAPEWSERVAKGIAARRVGTPADIASAVLYLASTEASWVTGTVFEVDGGRRSAV
jgi:3-oxoacyl-[acyl-carrier protein] reductase